MTPLSHIFFAEGLIALLWPLLLLVGKPRVLGMQWIFAAAMSLMGISIILLGCRYNAFLCNEYLLSLLYALFALFTPPVATIAVRYMTLATGQARRNRAAFLPALLMAALMFLTIAIVGIDAYRRWLSLGGYSRLLPLAGADAPTRLLTVVHSWCFMAVMLVQYAVLAVTSVRCHRSYQRLVTTYFTRDRHHVSSLHTLNLLVAGLIVLTAVHIAFSPDALHLWLNAVLSLAESILICAIGWHVYTFTFGAEKLAPYIRRTPLRGNPQAVRQALADLVERQQGFLDPDLSVFTLAERLKVSQDDVIDAVQQIHGTSFAGYIDSLRVGHALRILMQPQPFATDDPDALAQLAHRCGYLSPHIFLKAFESVVHMPLEVWYERLGGVKYKPENM